MMLLVDPTDPAQTVDRGLVIEMTYQCITGIGRQCDDAAAMNHLRCLLDQAQLGIFGMDLKKLAHEKTNGGPVWPPSLN